MIPLVMVGTASGSPVFRNERIASTVASSQRLKLRLSLSISSALSSVGMGKKMRASSRVRREPCQSWHRWLTDGIGAALEPHADPVFSTQGQLRLQGDAVPWHELQPKGLCQCCQAQYAFHPGERLAQAG